MKLIQARVNSFRAVRNSGWFDINRHITLFAGPQGSGKTAIFQALRTINPPAGQGRVQPEDLPRSAAGVDERSITPGKKTAALGVFAAEHELAPELATIDPVFYETEKIEVGRRLNNVRWITFVEIGSSHRWSDIAADMALLKAHLAQSDAPPQLLEQYDAVTGLPDTARIKWQVASRLEEWLGAVEEYIDEGRRACYDRVLTAVRRPRRFKRARGVVVQKLPRFIYFNNSCAVPPEIDLRRLAARCRENRPDPHGDAAALGLLRLAGFNPEEFSRLMLENPPGAGDLASALQERLAEIAGGLGRLVGRALGEKPLHLLFRLDGGLLKVYVAEKDGQESGLEQCRREVRWLLSFYVALQSQTGGSPGNAVLLLDEPDRGPDFLKAPELKKIVTFLAQDHQVLVGTRSPAGLEGLGPVRFVTLESHAVGVKVSDTPVA